MRGLNLIQHRARPLAVVMWVVPSRARYIYALNDFRQNAVSAGVVIATSTANTVYGYDAASGAVLWKRPFYEPSHLGLTADDSTAFVALASGGLVALNARDGQTRWRWGSFVFAPPAPDKVAIWPGQDRDYVYVSGLAKGWKIRK